MPKYKIVITDEFARELSKEIRLSKDNWGRIHAKKYFQELRAAYRERLQNRPQTFINPKHSLEKGRGYIRYKGHYIIFYVDEKRKEVHLLDLYGRNRFYLLQGTIERTLRLH